MPGTALTQNTRTNSKLSQGNANLNNNNLEHSASNCNHNSKNTTSVPKRIIFKSKRQLQEEEAQRNILKTKIKCKI